MAKFIALKDVSGNEAIINVDYIRRIDASAPGECSIFIDGDSHNFYVKRSALDVWKMIAAAK